MNEQTVTFGRVIATARKKLSMSQRQLAAAIKREDGAPISGAYLNDIEHDRRSPSPELVRQFAHILKLDVDYLAYLAGRFPHDRSLKGLPEDKFVRGMSAFRNALGK